MAADFSLSNKTALITGASSGIGQQQATALAEAGAAVVLVGRREDALKNTKAKVESAGGIAHVLPWNLDDRNSLTDLAAASIAFTGSIDILLNTAGVNLREPTSEITLASWDTTLNLNLAVPFFLAQALIPNMEKKGWGRIINIASLQTERAFTNGLAYGASKGGIGQLTRAMAESWSSAGINCNAIAPGFFPTELTAPVFEDAGKANALADQTCIGRNGALQDLDGVTVFLASNASNYITGQILYVDGGFTAR